MCASVERLNEENYNSFFFFTSTEKDQYLYVVCTQFSVYSEWKLAQQL